MRRRCPAAPAVASWYRRDSTSYKRHPRNRGFLIRGRTDSVADSSCQQDRRTQQGNDHPAYTPMGTFRASDGLVNIAASMPRLWERFCEALGADDLLAHPDYQTPPDRIARKDELKEAINAITGQRTSADLVRILNEAGVPCGPINSIGEGFEDPQVRHLGMAKPAPHPELGAVDLIRSPINLSRFPQEASFSNAAPDPGSDTRAVLAQLGIPGSRIDALASSGHTSPGNRSSGSSSSGS